MGIFDTIKRANEQRANKENSDISDALKDSGVEESKVQRKEEAGGD